MIFDSMSQNQIYSAFNIQDPLFLGGPANLPHTTQESLIENSEHAIRVSGGAALLVRRRTVE